MEIDGSSATRLDEDLAMGVLDNVTTVLSFTLKDWPASAPHLTDRRSIADALLDLLDRQHGLARIGSSDQIRSSDCFVTQSVYIMSVIPPTIFVTSSLF